MNRTTKFLYKLITVLLVIILVLSSGLIAAYFVQSWQSKSQYEQLAGIVGNDRPTRPVPTKPASTTGETQPDATAPSTEPENPYVSIYHPETGERMEILKEYAQVFMLNTDVVGWIYIEDTMVNYPVMQTSEYNADYYLETDFYHQWNPRGCLYVREQCDVFAPSDNIIIYGHRMQDGSMFGHLAKYENKEFGMSHRYIQFDTLYTRKTYEVAYVIVTSAILGEGFPYHWYLDLSTEEAFNDFVRLCNVYDIYETGAGLTLGDKLICLSTCEYTQQNGRLVIIAKEVWEDPLTAQH